MSSTVKEEAGQDASDIRWVQTNGEVTIPKELREGLGIEAGTKVIVSEGDGFVKVRPLAYSGGE